MKPLLIFLIFFFPLHSKCQNFKQDIQDNCHEIFINSSDTSFNDLVNLAEAVKNSKIVMLGEQTHGDGTTVLAKTRIIKFLHEKLGFNVLAFESDFISLDIAWDNVIKKELIVEKALNSNIYPVWTKCLQCEELFKYIEAASKKDSPLNIAGFDNQLTGVTAYLNLKKLLLDSIASLDSTFYNAKKNDFSKQIDTITNILSGKVNIKPQVLQGFFEQFIENLSILEDFFKERYPANNKFAIFIKSIKSFHIQKLLSLKGKELESSQERDSQMAINLNWLIQNKYLTDKIIVWAANSHIIKNYQQEINKKYKYPFSMGQILTRDTTILNKTYIIGFTGYTGESKRAFGIQSVINIPKPKKNSLEMWINETKKETAFIDFRKLKNMYKNELFYMNFKSWQDEKSDWLSSYDGIIYINRISPCKTLISSN